MKRLLLVDDADYVRLSIRLSLEEAGYVVDEAVDGLQALAALEQTPVDLMIIDLWMPRLDGIAVLKRLRVQAPDLKVIAISGGGPDRPVEFSVALALTWGAEAVLHKPFDNEDLVAEVRRLLGE